MVGTPPISVEGPPQPERFEIEAHRGRGGLRAHPIALYGRVRIAASCSGVIRRGRDAPPSGEARLGEIADTHAHRIRLMRCKTPDGSVFIVLSPFVLLADAEYAISSSYIGGFGLLVLGEEDF